MPQNNLREMARAAALTAVREHGLYGRPDSPPEWNQALDQAKAGGPILVKDPDDPRDDFFLVPLIPKNPTAKRGVWVILDPQTLTLREASLLENWKTPTFPDDNSGDAEKASQQPLTLPDGTVTQFKKEDFTPNKNNLVWKASAASILPYWPLKELTAPHPITGESVSIYVTQDGKVYSALLPDEVDSTSNPAPQTSPNPSSIKSRTVSKILILVCVGLLASTLYYANRDNRQPQIEKHQPVTNAQDATIEELRRNYNAIKKNNIKLKHAYRQNLEESRKTKQELERYKASSAHWKKLYENLHNKKNNTETNIPTKSEYYQLRAELERLKALLKQQQQQQTAKP